jgi:RimJ/RimL family protein N-acetyltransferase
MEIAQFRKAIRSDSTLYFIWANDPLVRSQSYNSENISIEEHNKWFNDKLSDETCYLYIFQNSLDANIGQVRIQKTKPSHAVIGLSIDSAFRGKGFGTQLLQLASEEFFSLNSDTVIHAYIKLENTSSKRIFEKAGFELAEVLLYNNIRSYHFIKYANRKF